MNIWLLGALFVGFWVFIIVAGYFVLFLDKRLRSPKEELREIGMWFSGGFGRDIPSEISDRIFSTSMKYLILLVMGGVLVFAVLRIFEHFLVI